MFNLLFIIIFLYGVFALIYLFILYKKSRRKKRAMQVKRDEHFAWLSKQVEEMALEASSPIKEQTNGPMGPSLSELWGYPPEQKRVLEGIYTRENIRSGWNFAVHIHEGAEEYLGAEQFAGLEERFASIPGVEKCMHEDREVFLVKAANLSADMLRKLIWQQFLSAAKTVYETEGEDLTAKKM